MADVRKPRKMGEEIVLGNKQYRIEGLAGCGGSSMVYYASYPDSLNPDSVHRVLVKELFPWHSKGYIYREENGNICCKPEGKTLLEYSRRGFYEGNKENLSLLERFPEQVSGNLDSYKAYGTYYSVLPFQGGCSLQQMLEDGRRIMNLRESVAVIREILDALECFHRNSVLHLDISPDNIMILPGRALLIDYNSVRPMNGEDGAYECLDIKEGYSAPEIILEESENIGPASDLYSVSAVWFRMLAGRRLEGEDLLGKGIRKVLAERPGLLRKEPEDVVYRVGKILGRGLHVIAGKRYQTTAEMREDLEELAHWMDGKETVSNTLWEAEKRAWEDEKKGENRRILLQYRKKRRGIKICMVTLAIAAAFMTAAVWRKKEPAGLSAEESRVVYAAVQRLEINMGVLNMQISAQNTILEAASGRAVLEGDREEADYLSSFIARKLEEADSVYMQFRDGTGHLEKLERVSGGEENIPLVTVNEVYRKPEEMKGIMEQAAVQLELMLCRAGSPYDTYGKREPLVKAYQEYLDAYTAVCYLEFSQVLEGFRQIGADESVAELMEAMGELNAFWDCIHTYSLGGMGMDEIDANLKAARRELEYAEMKMIACGLRNRESFSSQ